MLRSFPAGSKLARALRSGFTLTEVAVSVAVVAGLAAAVAAGVSLTAAGASSDASRYASSSSDLASTLSGVSGAPDSGDDDVVAGLSYGQDLTVDRWTSAVSFSPLLDGAEPAPGLSYEVSGVLPDGVTFDVTSGMLTVVPDELSRLTVVETGAAFDLGEAVQGAPAPGADGRVLALAVQSDGRILVGGLFGSMNGTARPYLVRLEADGTLDAGFDPVFDGPVRALALQPDGRILVGGEFTSVDGTPRPSVVRLTSGGELDMTFDAGSGGNGRIEMLELQPDGAVLVGGSFTLFDDAPRSRLARLAADGVLDAGFAPQVGGVVYDAVLYGDGSMLIGGDLTSVGGISRGKVARLTSAGQLDLSFDPGAGPSGGVYALAVQSDGRVLVGGAFTQVSGVGFRRIARLTSTGQLDMSFDPGSGFNGSVHQVVLEPDGRVLAAGSFSTFDGVSRGRLVRLDADGSYDPAVQLGYGADGAVYAVAVQPDGRLLLGGDFTKVNQVSRVRMARVEERFSGFPFTLEVTVSGGGLPEPVVSEPLLFSLGG